MSYGKPPTEYYFAAKYKKHILVLAQPDQNELLVFDEDDLVFLRIPLVHEDDLVKSISLAKEEIDQI